MSAGKFPGARIGENLIQRNVAGGEGWVARLPVSLPQVPGAQHLLCPAAPVFQVFL